ncbi:MAG: general secretion pathway protein GspD, partial [Betaproteobacteria bacterium]|nr:general secretion pathway protein GspD [Betaproteobacteria bacterium]
TISPQAGIVAVYAMPAELRQVEAYLRAARIVVERQVMLEAKIVEVELRDGFQSGIDWSILSGIDKGRNLRGRTTAGTTSGSIRNNLITGTDTPPLPNGNQTALLDSVDFPAIGSGLFGLAFSASGFQAVLGFLETYGNVQTLSSPRVATLNNQKAVLKVGADEYFITGVSGGTAQIGNNNSNNITLPTVTLTPFFSGIALDVTPQIDDGDMITLHVHPAISTATERTKQVNLGIAGNYLLPLAISNVNETDTIVRVIDGNIVAIGGLMQIDSNDSASGLPGTTNTPFFSYLFGNKQRTARKKELVVLLKPTIIRGADDWSKQTSISKDLLDSSSEPRRVITLDGNPAKAESR